MLTYRVVKWAFINDEPTPIMDYYRGPDLDTAQRIYARADGHLLRLNRRNPRVTNEAECVALMFERYPGRWQSIPDRVLDPDDVNLEVH